MKTEIEVGMYVRTIKNGIKKIYEIDEHKTSWKYLYKLSEQDGDGTIALGGIHINDITKPSYNIIDSIEVGDIVRTKSGYVFLVTEVVIDKSNPKMNRVCDGFGLGYCFIEDIESILTKEQFEHGAYKIFDIDDSFE